jgi:eukaryotic-like serine/threonine-protein kinase
MTARDPVSPDPFSPDPRLPELFAQARERSGAERDAFLGALRSEDPALASAVEELLSVEGAGEARFAEAIWGFSEEATALPPRVGAYRIEREIGRGGMARVFLAVQEEEDFQRTVALKLLDRPVLAEESQRRFGDEVRILASLEHPGIARFYDGGRTAEGVWFLALEYVEGEDLLSFVRSRNLGVRERVELFLQVLAAVDFAHRRLIVHRDLKPANVLVGRDGTTKLLDFGISKILEPTDGDPTRTEMRALTPAYASPEQLRGEPVTIAADVYSLGVMLFELLTGRRPASRDGRTPADRSPSTAPPETPSTVVRTTRSASGGASTADPATWRLLSGDLDAITLKALRYEPESRYRTAAELADDLQRWLRGDPVEARRGGRRYRLGKFVRRHRLLVSAAALAMVGLLAGGTLALWQARVAGRERDQARRAEAEARLDAASAQRITDLLGRVFEAASPFERPGTVATRQIFEQGAAQIAVGLAGEPELRAQLAVELGTIWLRLGDAAKAAALIEPAAMDLERTRGDADPRTAGAWTALARVRRRNGQFTEARQLAERALAVLRSAVGNTDPRTLETLAVYGNILKAQGDLSGARAALEEAVQGLEPMGPRAAVDVAKALGDLGLVLQRLEDWDGAERYHRRAHALLAAAFGPDSPRAALSLVNLADVLDHRGRDDEARAALEEVLRVNRVAFGPGGFPGESVVRNTLGWILLDSGAAAAAKDEFGRAIAAAERERGAGHSDAAWPMRGIGEAELELARPLEARAAFERTLDLRTRFWGRSHWEVAQSLDDLARVAAALGDRRAEESYLRESLAIRRAVQAPSHPELARAIFALARFYCANGKLREGSGLLAEGLARARTAAGSLTTEVEAATALRATCGL